jgi:hypothetical protein
MEKMLSLSHPPSTLTSQAQRRAKAPLMTRSQPNLLILRAKDKSRVNPVSMTRANLEVRDRVWDKDIRVKVKVAVKRMMMRTMTMTRRRSQWMT